MYNLFTKKFPLFLAIWSMGLCLALAMCQPGAHAGEPPYAFEINGKRGIPQAMLEQEPEFWRLGPCVSDWCARDQDEAAEIDELCARDARIKFKENSPQEIAWAKSCRHEHGVGNPPTISMLINKWEKLEHSCRGNPNANKNCSERTKIDALLKDRGCDFNYPEGWPELNGAMWKCQSNHQGRTYLHGELIK